MAEQIHRRNTRQRQVVLEELKKLDTHPTAADLYELARRRLPKISLGTVYRNLELLVEMGLVRKITTAGGEARFDTDVESHYHIRCIQCGRITDADGLEQEPLSTEIRELGGYEIVGYRLEFEGVCPTCSVEDQGERSSNETR